MGRGCIKHRKIINANKILLKVMTGAFAWDTEK
jgi:hypothetical protein